MTIVSIHALPQLLSLLRQVKENDNNSQTDTLPRKENENEASQVQC